MRLTIISEVQKVRMPNPENPDLHNKVPSNYRFARETIRLAKERGFDDGINLDQNGNISE
jgi:branched-subunit amino acid aminotransferase/4-amino-4-deoxychorismate lyase